MTRPFFKHAGKLNTKPEKEVSAEEEPEKENCVEEEPEKENRVEEESGEEITWENALPSDPVNVRIKNGVRRFFRSRARVILCILIAAGCAYFFPALYFSSGYMPKTRIGSIDLSGQDRDGAARLLNDLVEGYELRAMQRNGYEYHFFNDEVGLEVDTEKTLDEVEENQHPWIWPVDLIAGDHVLSGSYVTYDEKQVKKKLKRYMTAYGSHYEKPHNASIKYKKGSYQIKKEKKGDQLKKETVFEQIDASIRNLETQIDLDEKGCYQEPELTAESQVLIDARDTANQYVSTKITYENAGIEETVLDASVIHKWIKISDTWEVTVRKKEIRDYVEEMADQLDTAGTARSFHTHEGAVITLSGDYGWKMDRKAEISYLTEAIHQGLEETHTPAWKQTASNHGTDWGDTYVEIDIGLQKLWYYQDGRVTLEADIISGDTVKGMDTKEGLFYVKEKTMVSGAGNSAASRKLILDSGVMLYDAPWIDTFGGYEYLDGGTDDGGVCMARDPMHQLYEWIDESCPVLIHETETENIVPGKDMKDLILTDEEVEAQTDEKYEDYSDEEMGFDPDDEDEYDYEEEEEEAYSEEETGTDTEDGDTEEEEPDLNAGEEGFF